MLLDEVNIIDVIKKKTPARPEDAKDKKPVVNDNDDFTEKKPVEETPNTPIEANKPNAAPVEDVEDEHTEQDWENSAEALIDIVNVIQKTTLIFFGSKKIKKKVPKKLFDLMVDADIKDASGEELTEDEKKRLAKYKQVIYRLEKLQEETPLSDAEKKDLMGATKAFAKNGKIIIPPGLWFSVRVVEMISKRAINIAMM